MCVKILGPFEDGHGAMDISAFLAEAGLAGVHAPKPVVPSSGWVCELCGAHNYNPEVIVCWQCANDSSRAARLKSGRFEPRWEPESPFAGG